MNPASPLINWKNNQVPQPPFYASIFNYIPNTEDSDGYAEMDEVTLALAQEIPGYLGYESVKGSGRNSFISYWDSLEAIETWRKNSTHIQAKAEGKKRWYKHYHTMIARVESFHMHQL